MTGNVYGFGIYGMWGAVTDPGEAGFSKRVGTELGVNIMESPYDDTATSTIIAEILRLPETAIVLIWGTSLGANNAPDVAAQVKRPIHGIWGFQASLFGVKATPGTVYPGVTANVHFAHLIYSLNPINFGLGAYKWTAAPNRPVNEGLIVTRNDLPHPGDYDPASQNMFLAEMKRVIGAAS